MPQVVNGTKVYTPEELGIKSPSGGFQQGGWYQGRQYWNGVLSEPGVINPYSNQIGAGKPVSKEVVDKTNINNWDYLQNQRNKENLPPLSSSGGQVNGNVSSGSDVNLSSLLPQKPKIDVISVYNKYFETDEIKNLQTQIKDKENAYNKAVNDINDNPFYSEATRVGRINKLNEQYQRDISILKDDLAKKLADAQVKMNLELKQYDIDSSDYKEKLNLLNSFLEKGALINASGKEISDFAVALGVPTSFIENIINQQKAEKIKPKIITETDDSGNVSVVAIDEASGKILYNTSLGKIGKSSKQSEINGLTNTKLMSLKAKAGQILAEIDTNYQTINDKLVENPLGQGDKRLSYLEFLEAVNRFATESGLDEATAASLVEQRFNELGYKKWNF